MSFKKGQQSVLNPRLVSYSLKALLFSAMIMSGLYITKNIKPAEYFPIKIVRVFGVHRVEQSETKAILMPLVNRGFFTINVDSIRDRLLQLPWVATVFVKLHWPDRVEINLIERQASAIWNETSLLSDAGEIFSPPLETYPSDLPKLSGPPGKQILMMQYYTQMNRLLMPLHAKITDLEMTPYLSWKLKLDNGIKLQIGHKDILTRLDHFVKVYAKIVGNRAGDVDYIDLRYPNGLAVRFKSMA